MSYRGDSLAGLIDFRATRQAGEQIAQAFAQRGLTEIRKRTPVAQTPDGTSKQNFTAERGGRVPGTAKASWSIGRLTSAGDNLRVVVSSSDDLIDLIEFATRPHLIVAKNARALRFRAGGSTVFAARVNHPGTQGAHMVRDGTLAAELAFEQIAREPLAVWAGRMSR